MEHTPPEYQRSPTTSSFFSLIVDEYCVIEMVWQLQMLISNTRHFTASLFVSILFRTIASLI